MAGAEKDGIRLQFAVISHTGCVRKNNEDNFFVDGDLMLPEETDAGCRVSAMLQGGTHLLAVCDGMGGMDGGERASYIAVKGMSGLLTALQQKEIPDAMRSYLSETCEAILEDAKTSTGGHKEGPTMAMLYLHDDEAYIANVGDSRVYLLRRNVMHLVSEDHSPLYRAVKAGRITLEEMRKDPRNNLIDAYLGQPKEKYEAQDFLHSRAMTLCQGDRFLICSDGLSDLITHDELRSLADRRMELTEIAQTLVGRALEEGGKDNVTVIVAEVDGSMLSLPTEDSLAQITRNRYTEDNTTEQ